MTTTTTKTQPSVEDPYRSQNEWRAAQKHLIDNLKVGDRLVYIRLFHAHDAGAVTRIDLDKQAVFTDSGYEFVYNMHRSRYVLRGDPHAFMARYFQKGSKAYQRFGSHTRSRIPVANRSRDLD